MAPPLRIDPALVEHYLMTLARYGAVGETGVARTTYSPEWVVAQDQIVAWLAEAGLTVRRDAVGNVWGRLEGRGSGKAIVSGSHIDSQTPGGRYDGALGVVGAVIALRTLRERFGEPRRPLEAVSLCEEEGSRFPAAGFWGSRAIVGKIRPEDPEAITGYDGTTIAAAMRDVGLDPARIADAARDDIDAYVELHIEQGPILEQAGLPVAIVTAIPGIREYHVELRGRADHAGARPMDLRRDPLAGAAEIIAGVVDTAHRMGRPAVTTVGRMVVEPNFPSIIAERVIFTVDARHADPATRATLYARHEALMTEVAARRELEISWEIVGDHPPYICDPALVETLTAAAQEQGIPYLAMASGAVHDAQQMAARSKVAMIFVQSKDGRSHTPAEFSQLDHCVAGIELLAAALHRLAY